MKTTFTLLITILLLSAGTTFAQYDFKKTDSWLAEHAPEMGGRAVLLIWKDGKIIYNNAVNEMSGRQKAIGKFVARRKGVPANISDYNSSTRQPIASCSKWLSAALIMTFVDEGKLKLDDTVGKYLPVLSQNGKGNITISQCLSHTTGIKAPPLKENLEEMREISTMDQAITSIAALPMEGKPGTVFHYSNAGLQIAGAVIEKIAGKSFQALFSERIAQPLNMKNTDFGKGKVALPAGGAGSTPEDYTNFLVMILNKGSFKGKRILSESSVEQMQVNRITSGVTVAYSPKEAGDIGYGYGEWVMKSSAPGNLSQSVSSPGLFGSFPWIDNKHNYAAFLMTFYVKNDGRQQRYAELKKLVDEAVK